jgi:hypothetical protein
MCVLLCGCYNHVTHLVFSSTVLAFLTSVIQVKNRWKTLCFEHKLNVISWIKKGKKLLTYVIMLRIVHSSICTIPDSAARIKENAKCLDNINCQQSETGLLVCVARLPQSYWNTPCKNCGCESLTFFLEKWISILYGSVYILYINVYVLYIQCIYTLQVCMSTHGVVIPYVGWGCPSPDPQKIHCFKCEFCVWFLQCFSGM